MHLFSFINTDYFCPLFELYFIPRCLYSCLTSFRNEGLPSVANLHRDRITWLNMAPGLALARTDTNINCTPWSYQNELCLSCCLLVFVSFPTPSFCMCFNYEKWFCLKIGFAWKLFCLRSECRNIGSLVLQMSHVCPKFFTLFPWLTIQGILLLKTWISI